MFAILGDKGEAMLHGIAGRGRNERGGRGTEEDIAPVERIGAKMARSNSVRPAPTSPPRPTISPARTLERDAAHGGAGANVAEPQRRLPGDRAPDGASREGLAGHEHDQFAVGRVAGGTRGDEPAVAQDAHPVGERGDLVEPMADVEDGNALGAQLAEQGEKRCRLRAAEGGGGLVQDEHTAGLVEAGGDFDQLLVADAEGGRGGVRREFAEADTRQGGACAEV
jgi:hypothetical protein